MKPVWLPTLAHTEDTANSKEMNMEYSFADCAVKRMKFYNINSIASYIGTDDLEYSTVHANGGEYIIDMKISKLEKIIDEAHS